jgi:cytochrome c
LGRAVSIFLCSLLLANTPLPLRAAQASEVLAAKAGCGMCHAIDKRGIGPSYRDMAARHKDDPKARAMLIERVRKGSTGNWGKVPMTPIGAARINDADLGAVVDWILKQ